MSSKDGWKEFRKHIVTCFASPQIFMVWFVADVVFCRKVLQYGSIHQDFQMKYLRWLIVILQDIFHSQTNFEKHSLFLGLIFCKMYSFTAFSFLPLHGVSNNLALRWERWVTWNWKYHHGFCICNNNFGNASWEVFSVFACKRTRLCLPTSQCY